MNTHRFNLPVYLKIPVLPVQAGIASTHRSALEDSRLRKNDGVNEIENKKLSLKNRNFSNQTGVL